MWNSNSISTTYHSGQLAFDYKAFDPVARVLVESAVLAVRSEARWKTLKDLVADAKAQPGKITVANSGVGSHTHISAVALFKTAGADVLDVPYAAAQIVPNLLGGHVDAVVQFPGALAAQSRSAAVRLLAALSQQRDPALPDAHRAGAGARRRARCVARHRGSQRHAPSRHRRAGESDTRDGGERRVRSAAREALRQPAFLPAAEFGELIATKTPTSRASWRRSG